MATPKPRIGAVSYLNTKPLIAALDQYAPQAELILDLPSRLADCLAIDLLDVALIPSIEYFRNPGYKIFSTACIACDGPVQSVKLYSRVPPEQIQTLALDEGSRTSVALTQILLNYRFGVQPTTYTFPINAMPEMCDCDAILLIGDRAMLCTDHDFPIEWDLGEEWRNWTGLPFVFAMWIARRDFESAELRWALDAARDEGERQFEEIARIESIKIGLPQQTVLSYFRDYLRFHLGTREREALVRFGRLASEMSLIPPDDRTAEILGENPR